MFRRLPVGSVVFTPFKAVIVVRMTGSTKYLDFADYR